MGFGSTNNVENQYFRARKEAAKHNERLSSREGAAELIGCSVSTLSDYELGLTKNVPPDRVCKMADLYYAPELKGLYCLHECPIGRDLPISGQLKTIEQIAIQINRGLSTQSIERIKLDLLDIASDGKVSDDEKPKLASILDDLTQLQRAIDDLRVLAEKLARR
jgi:transcriptional regulator with XRE-family HTH domain